MSGQNIYAIQPFVVVVEVSVAIPLVFSVLSLCFGTFESANEAVEWTTDVRNIHDKILAEEDQKSEDMSNELGILTKSYIRTEILQMDILLANQEARKPGMVIQKNSPEINARDMYIYALKTAGEAATRALEIAEKGF